jgi:hypothetical protein
MLVSLPFVKQFLGVNFADTSRDPQLSALKDAAEIVVKNYCRREFEVKTYTEYHQGTDRRQLILRQHPVTSIANVWVDYYGEYGDNPSGSFPSSTLLTFGTDYDLDWDGDYPVGSGTRVCYSGVLLRMQTIWQMRSRAYYPLQLSPDSQSSDGSIKVVYTAGFDPIPLDIQYAVAYVVAYMRRTIQVGGELQSEKIDLYSYDLHFPRYGLKPAEIGAAREILARYREMTI